MEIRENIPLKDYTTFRIGGPARFFVEVTTEEELADAFLFARKKSLITLIIGGGSNMLVSDRGFDGLVIHQKFAGFKIEGEKVTIGAGENWDECARKIVEAGLWGIENLSFVPGDAAGLAVQNVGAYGQEASQVIEDVYVYDIKHDTSYWMDHASVCEFGYRSSIFNTSRRGEFVIMSIALRLSKNGKPNTSYGLKEGTIQEMRDQVIAIRKSKGQDPNEYRSAGSFFKNAILTDEEFRKLPEEIRKGAWDEPNGKHKIPAGFLLDKICNLKGLAVGGAKLSELQVINIINTGGATADDVLDLYKKARDIVFEKTSIRLINEPELVGFTGEGTRGYTYSMNSSSRTYGQILRILLILFIARVLAQLIQLIFPVSFLPEFHIWQSGALPYHILIVLQIILIYLMVRITRAYLGERVIPRRGVGKFATTIGVLYFLLMIFRMVAGLTFAQNNHWLHAPLPTLFHYVLAGFVITIGLYHLRATRTLRV